MRLRNVRGSTVIWRRKHCRASVNRTHAVFTRVVERLQSLWDITIYVAVSVSLSVLFFSLPWLQGLTHTHVQSAVIRGAVAQ